MKLTQKQLNNFFKNGYLILESVLPLFVLDSLRKECDLLVSQIVRNQQNNSAVVEQHGCIIEPLRSICGVETWKNLSSNSTNRELYIKTRSALNKVVTEFITGRVILEILQDILGENVFLLNEQYIAKPPHHSATEFDYHQDSEYMESDIPYVSCWMALDDMSEENGTLYMIPYPKSKSEITHFPSIKEYQKYHEDCASSYESKSSYSSHSEQNIEDEVEIPVIGFLSSKLLQTKVSVPAGSLVIISSKVLHRSGINRSEKFRRAFMPQYSADVIQNSDGKPVSFAIKLQ